MPQETLSLTVDFIEEPVKRIIKTKYGKFQADQFVSKVGDVRGVITWVVDLGPMLKPQASLEFDPNEHRDAAWWKWVDAMLTASTEKIIESVKSADLH